MLGPERVDELLVEMRLHAAVLAAVASALCVAFPLGGARAVLGIILGCAMTHMSFEALAKLLARMLSGPEQQPPGGDSGDASAKEGRAVIRAFGLALQPALALALLLILWYVPARPEGVALGAGLALLAAVSAAVTRDSFSR